MKFTRTEFRLLKNSSLHPTRLVNAMGALYANKTKLVNTPFLPLNLDIEPTVKCNLRCTFCQLPEWNRDCKDLTFNQFKYIIDQFPTLLKLKLQGIGEPFLNKEFFEMVEYAADKHILVKTTTNGTLFTDEIIDKIVNSKLHEISISVDGATKKIFEKIRKGANFEQVIEGIKKLISARKGKYPIISIWVVGTKDNINEIEDILRLCKELNVDKVTLQYNLNLWGKEELKKKLKDMALDENERNIANNAKELAKELKLNFRLFEMDKYSKNNKCSWPWLQAFITADGCITPCCLRPDPKLVNFGNIFEQPFKEIWNNDKYKNLRRLIKYHILPKYCKDCYI